MAREKNIFLWHEKIIPYLDDVSLNRLHKTCVYLRGNGWSEKPEEVAYVFNYSSAYLVAYHNCVMAELSRRGRKVDSEWGNCDYRGGALDVWDGWVGREELKRLFLSKENPDITIFHEHDGSFLTECSNMLARRHRDNLMSSEEFTKLCDYMMTVL